MLIYKFIPFEDKNSVKEDGQHVVHIGKILEKRKLSNSFGKRVNQYNYYAVCQRVCKIFKCFKITYKLIKNKEYKFKTVKNVLICEFACNTRYITYMNVYKTQQKTYMIVYWIPLYVKKETGKKQKPFYIYVDI